MGNASMNGMMIFRNDLRLIDNETLHNALSESDNLLLIFILENRLLGKTEHGLNKLGGFRAKFLKETLTDLKDQIEARGGKIYFAVGDYDIILNKLKPILGIDKVFITAEYTREEIDSEHELESIITTEKIHNLTAFHPEDIPYDSPIDVPNQYTAFRRKTENRSTVRSYYPAPQNLSVTDISLGTDKLDNIYDNVELLFESFELPTDNHENTAFPFQGGESHAQERIQHYIFSAGLVNTYKDTRNGLVGSEYSTKFSPWLANGSLSARYLWNIISEYEDDGNKSDSTYKVKFEILWRDYFKFLSMKHGDKIFWFSGLKPQPPNMNTDYELFDKWKNGETNDPFVNANMLELKHTGWMSNRGRQVVASYLTKDLLVDWRLGAELFEEYLLDYDVTSNYCNWQYQAGVGVDSRPFRKFNPRLQAERYDSNSEFRDMWLGQDSVKETLF